MYFVTTNPYPNYNWYDWIGFYTAELEKEPTHPFRWVVVKITPPDNSYIFMPRYKIICETSQDNFPTNYSGDDYVIFLVQNNLNNQAIIDYMKQWYVPKDM